MLNYRAATPRERNVSSALMQRHRLKKHVAWVFYFTTYPTFFILIAVHPFKTLCILDIFFIAFSARYSLFVLMCRKTYITHSLLGEGGGRVERRCWVNFQCRGVILVWLIVGQGPIALAVGAGGGLFGHFFSHLSFLFSFSLSLGDGPIKTEILSQRAVKPKTTNQPLLGFWNFVNYSWKTSWPVFLLF